VECDGQVDNIDADDIVHLVEVPNIQRIVEYEDGQDVDAIVAAELKEAYDSLKESLVIPTESGWSFFARDLIRAVKLHDAEFPQMMCMVTVNKDFTYTVRVHNSSLDIAHELFASIPKHVLSVKDLLCVLRRIDEYSVCCGNFEPRFTELFDDSSVSVAYKEGDFGLSCAGSRIKSTIRSIKCSLLVSDSVRCGCCQGYRKTLFRKKGLSKGSSPLVSVLSPYHTNSSMSREQLIRKNQGLVRSRKALAIKVKRRNAKLQTEFERNTIGLSEKDSSDIRNIMMDNTKLVEMEYPDPESFQRLFWEQQAKFNRAKSAKGMRWHPMIIKWCLYLRYKSRAAYTAMKSAGFIHLPSDRTLQDYSNFNSSDTGFSVEASKLLLKEIKDYSNEQKFVGVLFDEMRVREDLVYDRTSGELIGYVNLGEFGNVLSDLENVLSCGAAEPKFARYVLVLMIRGISTDLCFPFAHFATDGVTSDFLYPILWEAVQIIEQDIGLKVLFFTGDGASPNRRFFRMHDIDNESVVFSTENLYAEDDRLLFFISDVPHLIKTTRNCFANSFAHRRTRMLWKEGKDISWQHIIRLFENHCTDLYTCCPKLTASHVYMNAFSCMKVNLAAQILSNTVACALETFDRDSTIETVKFIRLMNRFFDVLNVRSQLEGQLKRNVDLAPYTEADDSRLQWLEREFLSYFDDWKQSITDRRGNFTKKEKSGMILSHQTLEGLEISVKSIVSCVRFLLQNGATSVLTHRFNQDPLEQHFSKQRQANGGSRNPSVTEFNHNINRFRVLSSEQFATVKGNIKDHARERRIDHRPLQRRK